MKIEGIDTFVAMGKENAEAMVKSSNAAMKGFEEISKASQDLAAKSAASVDAAVKAMFSCKNPTDLADLQTRLARESIENAIVDGRKFAELTSAIFTAALEPLNARFALFQGMIKSAA
jgi:phasin family protein